MAYSPIEDKYLSTLTQQQFPDMPPEPVAAEPSADGVQVAEVGATKMGDYGYSGQRQATMTDYDPTVRERMAEFLQAGFEKFGMDRYKARQNAQTLIGGPSSNLPLNTGLADIVPFLGTALQTQEAARMGEEAVTSAKQGNLGTAAMQAGGAALGLVPGVAGTVKAGKALAPKAGEMVLESMDKLGSPVKIDLMAYHGTPHQVDKFDSKKIGSGEGAQAYGYGLYFAEDKGVAKGYHTSLSMKVAHVDGQVPERGSLEWEAANTIASKGYDEALAQAEKTADFKFITPEGRDRYKQLVDVIKGMKDKKVVDKASGGVYTVDIPDEMANKMLDFDKPIGEQSQEIQALAKKLKLSNEDLGGDLLAAARGKTPKGAKMMRDAGIPGVRYLDQGSRGSDKAMKNIVVFPGGEDQIKILKQEGDK